MKRSRLLGLSMCVVLAGLVVPLRTATATLSPLASAGETVVFSDEFNDNGNGWTSIGTGTGQATIGDDPGGTGATVWYPTIQANNAVYSNKTLATPIQLSATQSQIDVYMRVRDNSYNLNNSNGNYFWVELFTGSYYGILKERPGNTAAGTTLAYRIAPGATAGIVDGPYVNAANGLTFMDYRLQIDFVPAGGTYTVDTMNLKGSCWNGSSYVDEVTHIGATLPANGEFTTLQINNRNGSSDTVDTRAYFDSVQISVVPEPATLALLGLGGGLFLRRRRQEA